MLQKNHTGGIQFQLRTLTALFADSRDYELPVLAVPAFTNCSGKAEGERRVEVGWGENCSFSEMNNLKEALLLPSETVT